MEIIEQHKELRLQGRLKDPLSADFFYTHQNVLHLDLRDNLILHIPSQIESLRSLQILRLDGNQLRSLPDQLFNLRALYLLTFSENELTYLSPNIGSLSRLKKLNMEGNKIKQLPRAIGELNQLVYLNISNNRFLSLPCSLLNLSRTLACFFLEWFTYTRPPNPKEASVKDKHGLCRLEQMYSLFELLLKHHMQDCALVTFLDNFSEQAFDANEVDARKRTVLHQAASLGDIGVIHGLLRNNVNPNKQDKNKQTPLCLAIQAKRFEASEVLIAEGADPTIGGGIYGSPLHMAVQSLEIPLIKAILSRKPLVDKLDANGNSPVNYVVQVFERDPEKAATVALMLQKLGANPSLKNRQNLAPLHYAVKQGNTKAVKALLRFKHLEIDQIGGDSKYTAAHLAAAEGHVFVLIELAKAGADMFCRNFLGLIPRQCSKGNFLMSKTAKRCERMRIKSKFLEPFISFDQLNQYSLKSQFVNTLNRRRSHIQKFQNQISRVALVAPDQEAIQAFERLEKTLTTIGYSLFVDQYFQQRQEGVTEEAPKPARQTTPVARKLLERDGDSPRVQDIRVTLERGRMPSINPGKAYFNNELSEEVSTMPSSRGTKQENLFYLKDLLLKEGPPMQQMEALTKLRDNQKQPLFGQAMLTLFQSLDFLRIDNPLIQTEILQMVGVRRLKQVRDSLKQILLRHNSKLDSEVLDVIEDTLELLSEEPPRKTSVIHAFLRCKSQDRQREDPVPQKKVLPPRPFSPLPQESNYFKVVAVRRSTKKKKQLINKVPMSHRNPISVSQFQTQGDPFASPSAAGDPNQIEVSVGFSVSETVKRASRPQAIKLFQNQEMLDIPEEPLPFTGVRGIHAFGQKLI